MAKKPCNRKNSKAINKKRRKLRGVELELSLMRDKRGKKGKEENSP